MSTAIGLGSYENGLALLLDQKLMRYWKVVHFSLRARSIDLIPE